MKQKQPATNTAMLGIVIMGAAVILTALLWTDSDVSGDQLRALMQGLIAFGIGAVVHKVSD